MLILSWIILNKIVHANYVCELPVVENGRCKTSGQDVIVSCGHGYELNGRDRLSCQAHKSSYVDLPTCDPVSCPLPPGSNHIEPDYMDAGVRYVKPNSVLKLKCKPEFIVPDHNVRCITNNTFSAINLPRCQAANCISPDGKQISNGQITSQHLAPGTKVLIECNAGFKKNTSISEVRCVSKNHFSFDLNSMCVAEACPTPNILNGNVTSSNTTHILPGEMLAYVCEPSYEKEHYRTVSCRSGHVFTGEIPRCIPKPCPGKQITNGYLEGGDPNDVLNIRCDDGFGVKVSENLHITCISDQIYYPEAVPACRESNCAPQNISNGEILYSGTQEILHGSTISIKCGEDYEIDGAAVATCNKGLYQPRLPNCNPISCLVNASKLENVYTLNEMRVYGGQDEYELHPGSWVQMICRDSYDLDRNDPVRCISSRIFNPPFFPKCTRVDCVKPVIPNGKVTSEEPISPNRLLTIQCETGYSLSHDAPVTCFSKTEYRAAVPACNPLPCSGFAVSNGTVHHTGSTIQPGRSVTVSCDSNYQLEGQAQVTCIAGDKTTDKPACTPRDCMGYPLSHGATLTTSPGTEVQIQCDRGYDIQGSLPTCIAGTLIQGDVPTCTPRFCPTPHVTHGTVTPVTRVTPGHSLTVTCDANYYTSHSRRVTCVTDNSFTESLPQCLPSNCSPGRVENSTNRHVRSYRSGQVIDVECREGYRKTYTNQVTCVAGAQLDPPSLPRCAAQPCRIPSITNSDVTSQRLLQPGENLSVTCRYGYQISSTRPVTCVTDDVYTTLPSCSPVACSRPVIPNSRILNRGVISPGTRVEIQCDTDYTISHGTPVLCETSDVFRPANLPSCNDKDCSLPFVANGDVRSATVPVKPDTTVTVTCNAGYDIVGPASLQCIRANTFSPGLAAVSCTARPCVLTTPPADGSFTRNSVNPGEMISVMCHEHYEISDAAPVYCVTDNQYSEATLPTCRARPCSAPTILHGTALGPVEPGERLIISCKAGYKISSTAAVSCVAGAIFSPANLPQCRAQRCPVPTTILHASLPTRDLEPGAWLEVTCDGDYVIDNPRHETRCVTLDQFSGPLPSCIATSCQLPGVSHGTWTEDSLIPGYTAQLQCDQGYTVTGTQLVRCISGSLLDKTLAVQCIENCDPGHSTIPHGYLVPLGKVQAGGGVAPGGIVSVKCNPGFEHVQEGEQITCVTGNSYTPRQAKGCRALPCPVPASPDSGSFTTTRTVLQPGETLHVTCDTGYTVTVPTITCVTGETFSEAIPTCRPRPCPVPTINHGTALHSSLLLQPDEKLEYMCETGYYNNKPGNVFCETDAAFTAPIPTCEPVRCPAPTIRYGTVQGFTAPSETVNITCDTGLVLLPPDPVRCVTETFFSPATLPVCTEVPCTRPIISHGSIVNTGLINPGDELTILCDRDYLPSSIKRVACISGDVFTTKTFPKCKPMNCEKPIISNGIVEAAGAIEPGDRVQLKCGTDYDVIGPGHLECVSNTTFLNQDTACKPKHCESPVIEHGALSSPNLHPGAVVRVECDLGYVPDCDVAVTCISANNFQPSKIPQCLPQTCKKPVVRNGYVTGPTPLTPGSVLIIQCRAGYTLTSIVPTTCVTLEQYSPSLLPACVPVRNCTVPHIAHGRYQGVPPSTIRPGSKLQYTCTAPGYTTLYSGTVQCLSDVYFHPAPPTCITEAEAARMKTVGIIDPRAKEEPTESVESDNPPSAVVGILITIIVIFVLIVILVLVVLRNKKYKQKLVALLGGTNSSKKYRPIVLEKGDIEHGKPPAPTPKRKTPRPAKPAVPTFKPPPKPSEPAGKPAAKSPNPLPKSTKLTKQTGLSGSRHTISSSTRFRRLYPELSEKSSKVSSETKLITDTELSTYPIVKPKPSKPTRVLKPIVKPITNTDLRRHNKQRSAFTSVASSHPMNSVESSVDSSVDSSLEASSGESSYPDLADMNSDSYDNVLKSLGLSQDDFKLHIKKSKGRRVRSDI